MRHFRHTRTTTRTYFPIDIGLSKRPTCSVVAVPTIRGYHPSQEWAWSIRVFLSLILPREAINLSLIEPVATVLSLIGEIYNFRELRALLEARGVVFQTTGDTEVLLESLLNFGVVAALPQLEGMFAFALLDKETNEIVLARDRFGTKPLFTYSNNDVFLFASEIFTLLPWIEAEPNFPAISAFLLGFSGPTTGFTFLRHVKFVEPGTMIIVRPGKKPEPPTFTWLTDFADEKEAELLSATPEWRSIDILDDLLHRSVRSQLFADAPVGAFCSGGVDSALIMAIATKYHNNLAVFHANVVGPLSEHAAAASLARHLKLDMKSVDVSGKDLIEYIPEVIQNITVIPFRLR